MKIGKSFPVWATKRKDSSLTFSANIKLDKERSKKALADSNSALRLEGVGMDEILRLEKEKTQRLKDLAKEHEARQARATGLEKPSKDNKKSKKSAERQRSRSRDRKDRKDRKKEKKKRKKESERKEKIKNLYKI